MVCSPRCFFFHVSYLHFCGRAHVRSFELVVDGRGRRNGIGYHVQSDDHGYQDRPTDHVLGHVSPASRQQVVSIQQRSEDFHRRRAAGRFALRGGKEPVAIPHRAHTSASSKTDIVLRFVCRRKNNIIRSRRFTGRSVSVYVGHAVVETSSSAQ